MPQQTDAELITQAQEIRDETTPLANTKERVYNMLVNIIESKPNNSEDAGKLRFRSPYDASVNTWPASGGSGSGGAIQAGNIFPLSVGGTLGGEFYPAGMWAVATVDEPDQVNANWRVI